MVSSDNETDDETTQTVERAVKRNRGKRKKQKRRDNDSDDEELEKRRERKKRAKKAQKRKRKAREAEDESMPFSSAGIVSEIRPQGDDLLTDSVLHVGEYRKLLHNLTVQEVGGGENFEGEYLYVESMTTGEFTRVRIKDLKEAQQGKTKRAETKGTDPEMMRGSVASVSTTTAAVSLFCQGLLSGIALLQFFMSALISVPGGKSLFLAMYQPMARDADRCFFVFTTLAFVGAADMFITETSTSSPTNTFQKQVRLSVMVLMYFVALLVSLLSSPVSNYLYLTRSGAPLASQVSTYVTDARLQTWATYDMVRFIACSLGWVLSCFSIHDIAKGARALTLTLRSKERETENVKLKLLRQQGFRLESLDVAKLADLQESTDMAAKAVREMLAVKNEQKRSISGADFV